LLRQRNSFVIHFLERLGRAIKRRLARLQPDKAPKAGHIAADAFDEIVELHRRRGSKIGRNVRLLGLLDSVNPHLISIGDYCVIGVNSAMLAHCPIKGPRPCSIGSYVYLSYGAVVLPGVTIGDCCIVGAGAVVTRDIPMGSIAAGNPARVIRLLSDAEKAGLVDAMEKFRYIGWDPDRPPVK
jgi:exopolysaccharide acyltransferase PssR